MSQPPLGLPSLKGVLHYQSYNPHAIFRTTTSAVAVLPATSMGSAQRTRSRFGAVPDSRMDPASHGRQGYRGIFHEHLELRIGIYGVKFSTQRNHTNTEVNDYYHNNTDAPGRIRGPAVLRKS